MERQIDMLIRPHIRMLLRKALPVKMSAALVFATLLFATAAGAHTEEKLAFSLKSAQEYAIQHNYDVRNARFDISAAKKQLREVAAGGLPQVSGSVEYQDLLQIPTQLIPGEFFGGPPGSVIPIKFGQQHNATLGVSASQLVFSGSYITGLQASKIFLRLTEDNLERSQIEVKGTVTQTYYLILVAQENQRILVESLQNLEKTHYEVRELFNEGFVEETDVKQLKISVTQLENGLNTIERNIDVAFKLLKFQMGIDLDQEIALTEKLGDILARVNAQAMIEKEFDVARNVNYRLLMTQERLAELSLRNEKSKFLPTVAAFAAHQRNAQRDRFNLFNTGEDWFPTTVVGLRLDVPIFTSGARIYKVQRAKISLNQARNNRRKAEQGLQLEFSKARSGVTSAYENYRNSEDNLQLSQEVYDITLEKYREGVSSSLDLVQIHNQHLAAQSEYIIAMSELLNAKNQLDKLLDSF